MKRTLSSLPVWSAACSLLLACEFSNTEPLPEDPQPETPQGIGGRIGEPLPGTGGNGGDPGPGPGGGSSCETTAPARTYQCAGSANEAKILDRDYIELHPMHVSYACGYDPYGYGTGGAATGGSVGVGGDLGYGCDGFGLDGSSVDGGDFGTGGATGEAGGATGWAQGGAPPDCEDEDEYYDEEFATGGSAGSVGWEFPEPVPTGWCADEGAEPFVAGISYEINDCQRTDLKLPILFEEPQGWYELKVFAGTDPCDRGELLTELAGFGTGATTELPVEPAPGSFLSFELRTDDYAWGPARIAQTAVPSSDTE